MDFDFELKRHLGYNGRWLPVNGTSHKFFVYSAFYDDRDPKRPVIKVIGVTHTRHSDTAYCRMYFREEGDGVKIRHVKANINIIRNVLIFLLKISYKLNIIEEKNMLFKN